MTTTRLDHGDLERRLVAVLREHAEEAMDSTDTGEQADLLVAAMKRDRSRRRRQWAVGVVAVAAVVIGVVAWAAGPGTDRADQTPATPPSRSADEAALDAEAADIASRFLDSYVGYDQAATRAMLAAGARPALLVGWDRWHRWNQASGWQFLPGGCEAVDRSASGRQVLCSIDYHGLRSDELGKVPFTGSTVSIEVDTAGRIGDADMSLAYETNGFSAEVWEPFADWVSKRYPADAAVMYADYPSTTEQAFGDRSVRLWRLHTREYVAIRNG